MATSDMSGSGSESPMSPAPAKLSPAPLQGILPSIPEGKYTCPLEDGTCSISTMKIRGKFEPLVCCLMCKTSYKHGINVKSGYEAEGCCGMGKACPLLNDNLKKTLKVALTEFKHDTSSKHAPVTQAKFHLYSMLFKHCIAQSTPYENYR